MYKLSNKNFIAFPPINKSFTPIPNRLVAWKDNEIWGEKYIEYEENMRRNKSNGWTTGFTPKNLLLNDMKTKNITIYLKLYKDNEPISQKIKVSEWIVERE